MEALGEVGSRELGVQTEDETEEAANPWVGLKLGESANGPLTSFCKFSAVLRASAVYCVHGGKGSTGAGTLFPSYCEAHRFMEGGLAQCI